MSNSINRRIAEYIVMMPYSLEFLTLQTIQDFCSHYVVLQIKKLDKEKPVLILRDEQHTKIFASRDLTKETIKEAAKEHERAVETELDFSVLYFLREEFAGR